MLASVAVTQRQGPRHQISGPKSPAHGMVPSPVLAWRLANSLRSFQSDRSKVDRVVFRRVHTESSPSTQSLHAHPPFSPRAPAPFPFLSITPYNTRPHTLRDRTFALGSFPKVTTYHHCLPVPHTLVHTDKTLIGPTVALYAYLRETSTTPATPAGLLTFFSLRL